MKTRATASAAGGCAPGSGAMVRDLAASSLVDESATGIVVAGYAVGGV